MTTLDRLLTARLGNLMSGLGKSLALAAVCALGLPACTDGGDGTGGPSVEQESTSLQAFGDCDELLGYFQDEALAELAHWGWFGGAGFGRGVPEAVDAPAAGGDASGGQGGGELGGGDNNGGPDFSATNNQEAGVDEPDQIKTDGEFIYVVRGDRLLVYAAADLSLQSETALGTWGARLLLDGDRVAVLADRWDGELGAVEGVPERFARTNKAEIAVYDIADRAAPRLLRRTLVEGNVVTARLVAGTARVVVHFDAANYVDFGDVPGFRGDEPPRADPGQPIGVDDDEGGTDTATPAPAPDGDGMEQRRDPQEMDFEAAVRQMIEDSVLDDWIPYRLDELEGEQVAAPVAACRQFHRPGERAGHGVTAVVSVDLDAPNAGFADPAVVTAPGVVYASRDSLYLTTVNHAGWLWGGGEVAVGGDVAVGGAATGGAATEPAEAPAMATEERRDEQNAERPQERQASQIHKLNIANAETPAVYRGSGRVFGTPLNQFSLGEHAEHLRIATTENRLQDWEPTNHLFVLGEADGALAVTGQVTDLAETERIYAVRMMGDRGFMVTFRQVDPLFTFDLSDPSNPQMLGELKIPGFSTYLHPFGADHLIGIGQSATDEGRITGMQLSLFDVSDMADPQQAHVHSLGEGWSEALYNHHAFLFWAPRNLLAIPVETWERDMAEGEPRPNQGLELYTVSAADGFAEAGFVHHLGLGGNQWAAGIERSLVIGERLYAMSQTGLTAHDLDAELAQVAQAAFPEVQHGGDRPVDGGREPMPVDPEVPDEGGDEDDF